MARVGIASRDLRGDSVNPSATHTARVAEGVGIERATAEALLLGLNNYSQSHTAGALRIDGRQRCLKLRSHCDASRSHARARSAYEMLRGAV